MKISTLIDTPRWEKARWRDTMFVLTPDLDHPAGLAPMFEDYDAATAIFDDWRQALGETDTAERLRVSIIHGVAPTGENGYTVHFATELMTMVDTSLRREQMLAFATRFHFRAAITTQNMEWFITSYERHGRYFVLPMPMRPEPDLDRYFGHRLWKTKLHHRKFSEVPPDDLDAIAIPS